MYHYGPQKKSVHALSKGVFNKPIAQWVAPVDLSEVAVALPSQHFEKCFIVQDNKQTFFSEIVLYLNYPFGI